MENPRRLIVYGSAKIGGVDKSSFVCTVPTSVPSLDDFVKWLRYTLLETEKAKDVRRVKDCIEIQLCRSNCEIMLSLQAREETELLVLSEVQITQQAPQHIEDTINSFFKDPLFLQTFSWLESDVGSLNDDKEVKTTEPTGWVAVGPEEKTLHLFSTTSVMSDGCSKQINSPFSNQTSASGYLGLLVLVENSLDICTGCASADSASPVDDCNEECKLWMYLGPTTSLYVTVSRELKETELEVLQKSVDLLADSGNKGEFVLLSKKEIWEWFKISSSKINNFVLELLFTLIVSTVDAIDDKRNETSRKTTVSAFWDQSFNRSPMAFIMWPLSVISSGIYLFRTFVSIQVSQTSLKKAFAQAEQLEPNSAMVETLWANTLKIPPEQRVENGPKHFSLTLIKMAPPIECGPPDAEFKINNSGVEITCCKKFDHEKWRKPFEGKKHRTNFGKEALAWLRSLMLRLGLRYIVLKLSLDEQTDLFDRKFEEGDIVVFYLSKIQTICFFTYYLSKSPEMIVDDDDENDTDEDMESEEESDSDESIASQDDNSLWRVAAPGGREINKDYLESGAWQSNPDGTLSFVPMFAILMTLALAASKTLTIRMQDGSFVQYKPAAFNLNKKIEDETTKYKDWRSLTTEKKEACAKDCNCERCDELRDSISMLTTWRDALKSLDGIEWPSPMLEVDCVEKNWWFLALENIWRVKQQNSALMWMENSMRVVLNVLQEFDGNLNDILALTQIEGNGNLFAAVVNLLGQIIPKLKINDCVVVSYSKLLQNLHKIKSGPVLPPTAVSHDGTDAEMKSGPYMKETSCEVQDWRDACKLICNLMRIVSAMKTPEITELCNGKEQFIEYAQKIKEAGLVNEMKWFSEWLKNFSKHKLYIDMILHLIESTEEKTHDVTASQISESESVFIGSKLFILDFSGIFDIAVDSDSASDGASCLELDRVRGNETTAANKAIGNDFLKSMFLAIQKALLEIAHSIQCIFTQANQSFKDLVAGIEANARLNHKEELLGIERIYENALETTKQMIVQLQKSSYSSTSKDKATQVMDKMLFFIFAVSALECFSEALTVNSNSLSAPDMINALVKAMQEFEKQLADKMFAEVDESSSDEED